MDSSRISYFISRLSARENRRILFFAAALLFAGSAALPLFSQSGLLNTRGGGDSPFLLQRLQQLTVALGDGHFPVRWMPDANYGYGYPFYNYYAPLSIYIASFFRLLGFAFVPAIKLTQLAGFLVAAGSMFILGRRWFDNNWAGLLAAGAYTFAPFHLVNIYVRGDSLAEFWAMAFYPLVVLTIDLLLSKIKSSAGAELVETANSDHGPHDNGAQRLSTPSATRAMVFLAIAFACLVLSHNISALIFTPFILLFIFLGPTIYITSPWQNGRQYLTTLFRPAVALFIGLVLSAWFWLPALAEQNLAQLDPVTKGYFHFSNHFRTEDLIQLSIPFDYDAADGNAFRMGLVQALLAISGLAILLTVGAKNASVNEAGKAKPKVAMGYRVFIAAGLILATLMITNLSNVLWQQLPLLPFVQFPWRFLSVQAFFVSLATAAFALLPGRRIIVPVMMIALMLSGLVNLKPDFLTLSDADVTAERLAQYEWFTGNIGSTVSAEYLPASVIPRPFTSDWLNIGKRNSVQVLTGELNSYENLARKAVNQQWQFGAAADGATATIPTIDWPNWGSSGEIDEQQVGAATGSGLIELGLPAGDREVGLALTHTPIRRLSDLIALAGLVITIALLRPWRSAPVRKIMIAAAILLLIAVLARIWPQRSYANNDLTWDFAQMAYLHHAEEGVTFENGAVMGAYEYNMEQVAAGEQLTISIDWEKGAASEVMLALATPAINRHRNAPIILASERLPLERGKAQYHIEIPENAPSGLYIPRLTMATAQSLTPSGSKRGDLFLRPIRIIDELQPASMNGGMFDARLLGANLRSNQILDVQLQWATAESIPENLNFSLRLIDDQGEEVSQLDNQPGYGFLPTSLWTKESWVDDWLALPLPDDVNFAGEPSTFALVARLYNIATGEVFLTKRIGELQILEGQIRLLESSTAVNPEDISQAFSADFVDGSPVMRLLGYDMQHDAEVIALNLYWESLGSKLKDYHHFVHLVDPETGQLMIQHDAIPRNNSYPTNQWNLGEIVVDPLKLDLKEVPPGSYIIYVGLYRPDGANTMRLSIVDSNDQPQAEDRLRLPETIVIN
jgi:hypothetical protein